MISLRSATLDDVSVLLPRMHALLEHEAITIGNEAHEAALRRFLGDASLGGVWLIEDGDVIGYAMVSFGYDLEFGGRDAFLTELWIDDARRGSGAGAAVLELLGDELRARDVRALHLQVRPDNPAVRLYERCGFERSPRLTMTRRLT
jgi:ribosomal protein S18 acetylase RimI-like enzyme